MSNSSKPRLRVELSWPVSLSSQPLIHQSILTLSPPKTLNAPAVVIPTPTWAAQPLGMNVSTATALVTSPLYARSATLTEIPMTATAKSQWGTRGKPHRSSSCRHSSRLPSQGRQSHQSLSHQFPLKSISSSLQPLPQSQPKNILTPQPWRSSTLYRSTHQVSSKHPPHLPDEKKFNFIWIQHQSIRWPQNIPIQCYT